MKDIKSVRSHVQAIGHVKNDMQNKYQTIISADTAGSAKELSEEKIKQLLLLQVYQQQFTI